MRAEMFINNVDQMAFDNWEQNDTLATQLATIMELVIPRAKSDRQAPMLVRARLFIAIAR